MAAKKINLIGQKFGRWTVIDESDKRGKNGGRYWLCKCDCGTIKEVTQDSLRGGKSTSCGCQGREKLGKLHFKDLTGQRFGRLTVIERSDRKGDNAFWVCKCDCGNTKTIKSGSLIGGKTTSCGCYSKEITSNTTLKDLTGQRFGRLTVIKRAENRGKNVYWLCKCDCGTIKEVVSRNLIHGCTQSCGCYNMEKIIERSQDENHRKFLSELGKKQTGEKNPFWKGGITPITNYLRTLDVVVKWRNNCQYEANYMCELSGKKGVLLNVHHLVAFSMIVIEAHNLHNIEIKPQVKDYTQEELKLLEEYVGSWHKDNSNAVVLSEDVHKLFHSLYGKGENTPEQFEEFKERYLTGEFKEILK